MSASRDPSARTSVSERYLIRAARRGDRAAESRLLRLYEPMVRHISASLYLQGGERDDLDQEARVGILHAIRDWDPERCVPFRCFAWLCAVREAQMAVKAAGAGKHRPLNWARPLEPVDVDEDTLVPGLRVDKPVPKAVLRERIRAFAAPGRPDEDPVVKTLARERLRAILERFPLLTELERGALVLSATHHTRRESAAILRVRERSVNNALQRARKKLAEPSLR